jgi:hypothetical protein
MFRCLTLALVLALPVGAASAEPTATVDLRVAGALDHLAHTNPVHYEKIRQMLAGLQEHPSRVEGDWLQVTFDAQDVNLSRLLIRTSYPPKQRLSFRLDDVRYTLDVTRRDLVGEFKHVN